MSRTIRYVPARKSGGFKYLRTPRCKHYLLAGVPRSQVVTEYDDKPIAALAECKHSLRNSTL